MYIKYSYTLLFLLTPPILNNVIPTILLLATINFPFSISNRTSRYTQRLPSMAVPYTQDRIPPN